MAMHMRLLVTGGQWGAWFEEYGENCLFIIMYSDGPLEAEAPMDLALGPCLGSRAKRPPGTEADVSIFHTTARLRKAPRHNHDYMVTSRKRVNPFTNY
jgi:hypothetical protein